MFYDDLLKLLNSLVADRCIEYSVIDHKFTEACNCQDEWITEMDCINYRWTLQKTHIEHRNGACDCECRKVIESHGFHHSCELLDCLNALIQIHRD